MKFKTVETSFLRVDCTLSELFNNLLDVIPSHLLWYWVRPLGISVRSAYSNGWRCERSGTTDIIGKDSTTRMPDLQDDFTVLIVYSLGYFLPSFNLFFRVDAAWTREGIWEMRDLATFWDNGTKSSTLRVVFYHKIVGDTHRRISLASGHCSHYHTVLEFNRTEFQRL